MSETTELGVILSTADGTQVGEVVVPKRGAWSQIPPAMAAQLIKLEGGWTVDMVLDGRIVALVTVTEHGVAEYFIGPAEDAKAKMGDTLGGKGDLICDSYVLKADGSIEK